MFEVAYKDRDADGQVKLEFTLKGATPTFRWFKDDASALNFAGFVAAQHGANDGASLRLFLEKAGFPEDCLRHFAPVAAVARGSGAGREAELKSKQGVVEEEHGPA